MPHTGVAAEAAVVSCTGASTQMLLLALEQPGGPVVLLMQEANTGGLDGGSASAGLSLDAVRAALVPLTALIAKAARLF